MFARIKKSGRNEYLQLVENRRDNKKISQRVVATIGRMDELQANGNIETIIRSLSRFAGKNLLNISTGENSNVRATAEQTGSAQNFEGNKGNRSLEEGSRQGEELKHSIAGNAHIYKTIWESSLAGIYISQNGIFQAVSPLAVSFTGFSLKELIGKNSDSMIFPADLDNVKRNAGDMLGGKRLSPYEFRIITKQQNICWIMETVTSTIFQGKPAILGNFINITKRKIVENKLQESDNLYRAIFETTGTATIIIEDDMTISLLNSEFENMTGYRRAEWEGKKKWPEYIPEKDLVRMKKTHRLRRLDRNAAPRNFEHDLIDSGGKIRNMFLTADIIPGTKKSVVSFTDITAWKEAEQGLKNREQELQIKSLNLEELNTALRVLLKQREKDREELEEKVLTNVKEFVLPYVEKTRNGKVDEKSMAYLGILESNLKDIIAPFSRKLSSKYMNLTPKEIQIANFIKEGKNSKEIADIMNVSKSAIDVHRYRLRTKLGLNNQKANLKSHLTQYL
ncbi:MAG: PAS domain S-box protein [Smithellaceae bacterium]|nr:PAS domain S-box protein [Smithellaceae bacterium]